MCGRFSLIADLGELAARFEFDSDWDAFDARHNIAPTQDVLTIVGGENRRLGFMRWGLIPRWAKSPSIGARMINARAETVAEKPAFRAAFRHRRCLVPADGFYEWRRVGKSKIPMRIVMRSREPFAFAGIWSVWRDADGERVPTCAIITTTPNATLAPIHNRMPVILSKDAERLWLDDGVEDPDALSSVLLPYPADLMEAYQVSPLVNSVANDGPEIIDPSAGLSQWHTPII